MVPVAATSDSLNISVFNANCQVNWHISFQHFHIFTTASLYFVSGLSIGVFLCMVSVSSFLMISLSALHIYPNHSIILICIHDRILCFPYSLYRSKFVLFSNILKSALFIGPTMFLSTFPRKLPVCCYWGLCFTCTCNYWSQITCIEQSFWLLW